MASTTSYTGCVKWFNNNLNYGFITVLTEGEHQNKDIFVHQSNIKTKRDCFRTLYSGECVQFELIPSQNSAHPVHAVNVSGFNGVMLHCENPAYRPRRFNNRNSTHNSHHHNHHHNHHNNRRHHHNNASGGQATSETTQSQSQTTSEAPETQPVETSGTTTTGKTSGRGRPRKQ